MRSSSFDKSKEEFKFVWLSDPENAETTTSKIEKALDNAQTKFNTIKELNTKIDNATKKIEEANNKNASLFIIRAKIYEELAPLLPLLLQTEVTYKKALSDIQKAIELEPANTRTATRFNNLKTKLDDVADKKAAAADEEILAKNAQAIARKQTLAAKLKAQTDEAEEERKQSILESRQLKTQKENRDNQELRIYKASWNKKSYTDVLEFYNTRIELTPKSARNHRELGLYYLHYAENIAIAGVQKEKCFKLASLSLLTAVQLNPLDNEASKAYQTIISMPKTAAAKDALQKHQFYKPAQTEAESKTSTTITKKFNS